METIGIELHLGATGAAAKEIDGPTFAHHIDGPFPGFGTANRFDCHIATTLVGRKHSHRLHRIFYLRDLYYLMRTHTFSRSRLGIALHYGDHITANRLGYLDEHQTDRTAAEPIPVPAPNIRLPRLASMTDPSAFWMRPSWRL